MIEATARISVNVISREIVCFFIAGVLLFRAAVEFIDVLALSLNLILIVSAYILSYKRIC